MRWRSRLGKVVGALLLGLLLLIALNSGLGVDREETFTDLHRPEIVGESAALRP